MKRRKQETKKPCTKDAVNECAKAMKIAKKSEERLNEFSTCVACSGLFIRGAMIPICEHAVFRFISTEWESVSVCLSCAQDEETITKLQKVFISSGMARALPERRVSERRGQFAGKMGNAYAIIDKTRVKEGKNEQST